MYSNAIIIKALNLLSVWYNAYFRPHAVPFILKAEFFVLSQCCCERFQFLCPGCALQATQLTQFCRVLFADKPHRRETKVSQLVILVARPTPVQQTKC